jgi:hypothetical protein
MLIRQVPVIKFPDPFIFRTKTPKSCSTCAILISEAHSVKIPAGVYKKYPVIYAIIITITKRAIVGVVIKINRELNLLAVDMAC